MGNYLPTTSRPLESCTPNELQEALRQMGCLYQGYGSTVEAQAITGKLLAQIKPSKYDEFLRTIGQVKNPLHRLVLAFRIKAHLSLSSTKTKTPGKNSHVSEDALVTAVDNPQDLVTLLQGIGPEYHQRYGQAVSDNCVGIAMLGKIPFKSWSVVLQGLGITDIVHQNVFYNAVLDEFKARFPTGKGKRKATTDAKVSKITTATTVAKSGKAAKAATSTVLTHEVTDDSYSTMTQSSMEEFFGEGDSGYTSCNSNSSSTYRSPHKQRKTLMAPQRWRSPVAPRGKKRAW